MARKAFTSNLSYNLAFILLCLTLIAFTAMLASQYKNAYITENLDFSPIEIDEDDDHDDKNDKKDQQKIQPKQDQVCMSKDEYEKLKEESASASSKICILPHEYKKLVEDSQQRPAEIKYYIPSTTDIPEIQSVQERDYRVLHDPLYPPLNRTDASTYQALRANMQKRNWYNSTSVRASNDTYRLVAYVTSKNQDGTMDAGGNNWKLMARMKDRNTADFYMIPANRNYDMKIHISDDMVVGTRLRDLYTIPDELVFNTPLLHKTPYIVTEVDKSDLVFTNNGMYM